MGLTMSGKTGVLIAHPSGTAVMCAAKEQKHDHVRKIIDKVFVKFTAQSGEDKLSFHELYTAILLVYK